MTIVKKEKMDSSSLYKSKDTNQRINPKAVIFTHFGSLKYGKNWDEFRTNEDSFINQYIPILKSYLECNIDKNQIQIVYVYVDWAVQKFIPNLKVTEHYGRKSFSIIAEIQQEEHSLFGILRAAEREARRQIGFSPSDPPKFYFIGLNDLIDILNNLIEVEPSLIRFLCGKDGFFGYDSPKFVEAVIRLARGDIPHLAVHPIIRIDEDAIVPSNTIDQLIMSFKYVVARKPFFFFSGSYGRKDGKIDPINDYAVRVHWFYPTGTKSGDIRFEDDNFTLYNKLSQKFLSDLSLLGAVQCLDYIENISSNAKTLLESNELIDMKRNSKQVISGAGLIMARRAVRMLPPFMNFTKLTTWVDDHLKRLLHEMLGDIAMSNIESVDNATIQQQRHHLFNGITQNDINWANKSYFNRLLRGCIMHAMITTSSGNQTEYSSIIRDISWGKKSNLTIKDRNELKKSMYDLGYRQLERVLKCWSSIEFRETIIYNWAMNKMSANKYKKDLINSVISDSIGYIDLLLNWAIFTCAVERLSFISNDWLFEEFD